MLFSQPARRHSWPEEKWKTMFDNPIESFFEAAEGVVDKGILLCIMAKDTFQKFNSPTVPEEDIHNILHENWKQVFTKLADKW